jgi:hypothetical protein
MLSEADLDPIFDDIHSEAFRLEALPAYDVSAESRDLRAYLTGEPFHKSEAGQAFHEWVRSQVEAGVTWHRVRVVRGPLSDYERWEFEWGYTWTEQYGHHTFVLDLTEVSQPPELPNYDWWMLDERLVLRFHYSDTGEFIGADRIDDPAEVAAHAGYRDAAVEASTPFPEYWAAHPQYWRENWLASRS